MVLEPLLWPSGIFQHSFAALTFTGSHRQKRVTAITPNHYLSDLVYSSIKSSNHSYDLIDQTSPIKTQPEIVSKEVPCALTHHHKFLPVVTSAHKPTHVTASLTRLTHFTRPTRPCASHCHATTSALVMLTFLTLTAAVDWGQNFSKGPILCSFSCRFRFWASFLHLRSLNPTFWSFSLLWLNKTNEISFILSPLCWMVLLAIMHGLRIWLSFSRVINCEICDWFNF